MSAGHEEINGGAALEQALRRIASSGEIRRDMMRLPQFRVQRELPEELSLLLLRLEIAENRRR